MIIQGTPRLTYSETALAVRKGRTARWRAVLQIRQQPRRVRTDALWRLEGMFDRWSLKMEEALHANAPSGWGSLWGRSLGYYEYSALLFRNWSAVLGAAIATVALCRVRHRSQTVAMQFMIR